MAKEYSVNQWGSHPDDDNDDCWTGEDFATKEEALEEYNKTVDDVYCMYIQIDGPDIHEVRKNPGYSRKAIKLDYSMERAEGRMQAGMMGGVQAYNDYDNEEPWGESGSAF